jgi:hypothetical protein
MPGNTWKIFVGTSLGIETQDEVASVEEALAVVQKAMREMANDPGSDLSIYFDDKPLDAVRD